MNRPSLIDCQDQIRLQYVTQKKNGFELVTYLRSDLSKPFEVLTRVIEQADFIDHLKNPNGPNGGDSTISFSKLLQP
jgi:hypothetical protein